MINKSAFDIGVAKMVEVIGGINKTALSKGAMALGMVKSIGRAATRMDVPAAEAAVSKSAMSKVFKNIMKTAPDAGKKKAALDFLGELNKPRRLQRGFGTNPVTQQTFQPQAAMKPVLDAKDAEYAAKGL